MVDSGRAGNRDSGVRATLGASAGIALIVGSIIGVGILDGPHSLVSIGPISIAGRF